MLLCICVAAWCFCKTKLTQLHFYCKVCESFEDIIQPTRGLWVKRKTYESNPKFNNLDLLPTLLATLWMSLLQFGRPKDLEFISSELLTSVRWFCFSRVLDKKKNLTACGEAVVNPDICHYFFQDCHVKLWGLASSPPLLPYSMLLAGFLAYSWLVFLGIDLLVFFLRLSRHWVRERIPLSK